MSCKAIRDLAFFCRPLMAGLLHADVARLVITQVERCFARATWVAACAASVHRSTKKLEARRRRAPVCRHHFKAAPKPLRSSRTSSQDCSSWPRSSRFGDGDQFLLSLVRGTNDKSRRTALLLFTPCVRAEIDADPLQPSISLAAADRDGPRRCAALRLNGPQPALRPSDRFQSDAVSALVPTVIRIRVPLRSDGGSRRMRNLEGVSRRCGGFCRAFFDTRGDGKSSSSTGSAPRGTSDAGLLAAIVMPWHHEAPRS